ncbi:hypothetical protein COCON_G00196360 [Conger conger]|uniref:PDZ domain-containing protein n=1 Tax=Conger conger TaxID=82655 RepID=A0A9Q1D1F0_CONCO|nr:cytohesin-interacting protein [Conger conger]KAJ8255772.1 hypothetical protein COCON_G00196360 [Conger conger]
MTAVISTMSFKGLHRQNSHDNYILEGSLRNKRSLWHRCSLNGERDSKHRQNAVTSFATLPRGEKQVVRTRSNSLVDYTDPQRTTVVLEKQDNETFGFEVQTYGLQQKESSTVEMCTFVCKVQEHSPAEVAGLTTGDVIVSINGRCTDGSAHQHIVNLIRGCTNVLTMETVSGAVVKRIELEKKLRLLKQSLKSKWVELNRLTLQEQRLAHGDVPMSPAHPSLDSPVSLPSPAARWGLRYSSDSSCRSMEVEEGGQSPLPCVFEDLSPISAFPWDLPSGHPRAPRGRSSSLAGSSDSLSPCWDSLGASSPFGTLPRKGRKASVRRRILKFIPGLNHSLEEEEN